MSPLPAPGARRPSVALVICTHDRAAALASTLASLTRTTPPATLAWQLLVVANACTDDTAAVVAAAADQLPLTLLEEPTPGLSHARNRALDWCRAHGVTWVCWNDDDLEYAPGYRTALEALVQSPPPDPVVGGRIRPRFLDPVAPWAQTALDALGGGAFSSLDLGDTPRRLPRSPILPFGANLLVRLDATGDRRFDPRWGVTPTRKLGFEETEFLQAVVGDGCWSYEPALAVEHLMPPKRQSLDALMQFSEALGYGLALRHAPARPSRRVQASLAKAWLVSAARYHRLRLTGRRDADFFKALHQAGLRRGRYLAARPGADIDRADLIR